MKYVKPILITLLLTITTVSATSVTADLKVNPNTANTHESVTFDASGSSGSIDRFEFDLDGDGSFNSIEYGDGIISRTFDHSFSADAQVRVYGDSGNYDTATDYYTVSEDDYSDRLDADLEITPTYADTDESVTFDASGSSGSIDRFEFDLDGDGSFNSIEYGDGIISRTFDHSFSGNAEVKIYDEHGNSDTASDYYNIDQETEADSEGNIEFTVEDDDGDKLEDAYVRISNGDYESEYTDSNGETDFYNKDTGEYDIYVSCEEYDEDNEIDVNEGNNYETIRLDLHSFDNVCDGDDEDEEETEEDDGELTVNVKDSEGEELNADVEVNGRVELTGGDGSTSFDSLPRETHVVKVAKEDYETEYKEVDLEEDETVSIDVTLYKTDFESPKADFDWNPVNPEVSEQVEFDASPSTEGDKSIVDYRWSFGDGSTSMGSEVSHNYENPGDYRVRLEVEDSEGNEDTEVNYVNVGEDSNACGVYDSSRSFRLDDYSLERGESTDAEVRVFNTGSEDQKIEVNIKVGRDIVEQSTLTVDSGESLTISESISPDSDSFVTAEVSTKGDSCGDKRLNDVTKELNVYVPSDEEASLNTEVYTEDGEPVENARVEVNGIDDRTRFTDFDGEAGFSLEEGDYDIQVFHPKYKSEFDSVELFEGDDETLDFTLEERTQYDEDDGTLDVTVLDENGDYLEDARVRAENGDDKTRYTDEYGFVSFRLEEDGYDIEVSHPDYSDEASGYEYVEADERQSRTFRLGDSDGLEIVSVDEPDRVCRGETASIDYTVRNNEEYDESATTTASGFGSNIITNRYVVDEGDTVSGTLRFTNVEGIGNEEFTIRVENGISNSYSGTVEVENCNEVDNVDNQDNAAGVSMKLSYPVAPNKAQVGDTVKVTGFVEGVYSRSNVNIDVDGLSKASVSTQPDGYYQTYFRVDSVGTKTVEASSRGKSASRQIEVLPTATVGGVEAPRQVFEGESFEICSQVSSQIEAKVMLVRDGEVVKTKNGNNQVCFGQEAYQPGSHTYEVTGIAPGDSSTSSTSVRVLKSDVQASSFPDKIASVESSSGMVKVDLYNTDENLTRYDVDLSGLPSTWVSQTDKQVVLNTGERETVYFQITPRDEGDYDPGIVVSADGSQIYRQKVDLEVGGRKESSRQSFVGKITDFLL